MLGTAEAVGFIVKTRFGHAPEVDVKFESGGRRPVDGFRIERMGQVNDPGVAGPGGNCGQQKQG